MFNSNQKKRQRLINLPFFFVIFLLSIQLGLNANPSPPESIEAKAPWFGNLIIEWIDSSLDEESYALQYRTNPQSDWVTLSLLNASTKSSKLSGGSPGQEYEFRVLSIKGDKISSSPSSKTIMPDTFLNPPFAKINEGQLFEIELMANNLSKSETVTYSASPLPKGLSINPTTGKIRGIVEEDGFFDVIIRADYDSPESTPSISKLALRIPPQLSAPVLVNPIPDQSLTINQSNITLDLNNYINDPDTQKAIEIITNKGVMIFSLFEKATPAPVNNFLDYVENETYKNNVFHRSVTNDGMSIIQSGSFTLSETRLTSNLTKDPIINAPGIPNTKGTIAYARTSNPDSATSGWYINVSDSPGLDSGDSYTVFGRATDGSISVIETIQEIPTASHSIEINNQNTILNDFPTTDGLNPNFLTEDNIVIVDNIRSIRPIKHEIISISNPSIASIEKIINNNNTNLLIKPITPGSSKVTIRSTDIDGNFLDTEINVTVFISFKEWASNNEIHTDNLSSLPHYAFGSEEGVPRTLKFRKIFNQNHYEITFYHRKFTNDLHYTLQSSTDLKKWSNIWVSEDGKNAKNVIDFSDEGEFVRLTLTNKKNHEQFSNFFYRVLVKYSDVD